MSIFPFSGLIFRFSLSQIVFEVVEVEFSEVVFAVDVSFEVFFGDQLEFFSAKAAFDVVV